MNRIAAFAAGLVLIGAITACDSSEESLQTRTRAEVEAAVSAQAAAIATTAGASLTGWRTTAAPCTGKNGETAEDGRWHLTGAANIPIPPEAQVATIGRVRDTWRQQGFEITEDDLFEGGTRASVGMRDATGGMTATLSTVQSRDSAALIVTSFCYMPSAGEDPANEG